MISWQRGKTAPLGVFAMAKSLSCATHVKSLSRHKVLQIDAAADAAPWPFMAAPVAVEERNLHCERTTDLLQKFFRLFVTIAE